MSQGRVRKEGLIRLCSLAWELGGPRTECGSSQSEGGDRRPTLWLPAGLLLCAAKAALLGRNPASMGPCPQRDSVSFGNPPSLAPPAVLQVWRDIWLFISLPFSPELWHLPIKLQLLIVVLLCSKLAISQRQSPHSGLQGPSALDADFSDLITLTPLAALQEWVSAVPRTHLGVSGLWTFVHTSFSSWKTFPSFRGHPGPLLRSLSGAVLPPPPVLLQVQFW